MMADSQLFVVNAVLAATPARAMAAATTDDNDAIKKTTTMMMKTKTTMATAMTMPEKKDNDGDCNDDARKNLKREKK